MNNETLSYEPEETLAEDQGTVEHEDAETTDANARCYETLDQFVEGYIAHIYNRKRVGAANFWCRKWWAHPEAVARLGALWHAWEYLRLADPTEGIARWFVQYGDPIMRELTSPEGTFKLCNDDGHRNVNEPEEYLACQPANGLFDPA